MVGFNGGHYDLQGAFKSFALKEFPREIRTAIKELHEVTTNGDQNRWNRAKFTITPDKKIEIDFIWDQEWQDRVDSQ